MMFGSLKQAASEYSDTLIEGKKLGFPLLASDLAPKEPVSPEENLVTDLRAFAGVLADYPFLRKNLDRFRSAAKTVSSLAKFRAELEPLSGLVSIAERAAIKSACDFELDWDLGTWSDFGGKTLAASKSVVVLLTSKAIAEARVGLTDAAIQDLSLARGIAPLLRSTPILLHHLTAVACETILLRSVEEVTRIWHRDVDRLIRLQTFLQSIPPAPTFRHALSGEFYLSLFFGRNGPKNYQLLLIRRGKVIKYKKPNVVVRDGEPNSILLRAMVTRALQLWIRFAQELDKNPSNLAFFQFMREFDSILSRKHSFDYRLVNSGHRSTILMIQHAILADLARQRTLQGLLAVLIFREQSDRYPRWLAEAGYHEPDPFGEQPLKISYRDGKVQVSCSDEYIDRDMGEFYERMHIKSGPPQIIAWCPTY
jgi:hypothetical protein